MGDSDKTKIVKPEPISKEELQKLEEEELIFNHGLVERWKQQAKEMEKEQHNQTYIQPLKSNFQEFEHYWEQTYGGNK